MGKKKIKAAIIGCGRIAYGFSKDPKQVKPASHFEAYESNSSVDLVAVCDRDNSKSGNFEPNYRFYEDYRNLIDEHCPDIISICTPPGSHFEVARYAVNAGVKAIFCEKPMVSSLREADELAELVKKNKTVLAVNFMRRWDPFLNKIADFIMSGALGKIILVDCYYTAGVINTGSHMIDLLKMLTGCDVEFVRAEGQSEREVSDPTVDVILRCNKQFNCYFHGMEKDDYMIFEMNIYGSKGKIILYDNVRKASYWVAKDSPNRTGYKELAEEKHNWGERKGSLIDKGLEKLISAFNGEQVRYCNVNDGAKTIEVLAGIMMSVKKHGEKVSFPLKNRDVSIGGV
ncbi:MAG: Gfo/Idh/MocA family oxidoreductase [bacterium]|nr:Gfo/Idh/MocA family oxidoreductase [bacterium]